MERESEEKAAKRILFQQSQLAVDSQPTTAVIEVPNIVAGQSAEEMVRHYQRFIFSEGKL